MLIAVLVGVYLLRKKFTRWIKLQYFCYQIEAASKRGDKGAVVNWGLKVEDIGWNWDPQKRDQ